MTNAAADPVLRCASAEDWEAWLQTHHAESAGVWLELAKKGAGIPSVTYDEAVEVALCYGWVDGQKRSQSAEAWLQRFTPRRPRSIWSKVNRERIARLEVQGRLRPAGVAAVAAAQADGRWDAAYDSQRTAVVPDDFAAALAANPEARAFFATLTSANRYAFLFRLQNAKRPATRAARIEQFVALLAAHKSLHPDRAG